MRVRRFAALVPLARLPVPLLRALLPFDALLPEPFRGVARALAAHPETFESAALPLAKRVSRARRPLVTRLLGLLERPVAAGALPPVLFTSPTSDCNLRCADCLASAGGHRRYPLGAFGALLHEARAGGCRVVAVSGGEPLLYDGLTEAMRAERGLFFVLFTNGTLLDAARRRELLSLDNVLVFVSLEGLAKRTDARRGAGVFETAVTNARAYADGGGLVGTSVMVTRENADETTSDAFAEFLVESGFTVLLLVSYRPVGRGVTARRALSRGERASLAARAVRLRNRHGLVVFDNLGDVAGAGGCLATHGLAWHVAADGRVTVCPPLPLSDFSCPDGRGLARLIASSRLAREIRAVPTTPGRAECLLLDRPRELLDAAKRAGVRLDEAFVETARALASQSEEHAAQRSPTDDYLAPVLAFIAGERP